MRSCATKFRANAGKLAFAAAGALLLLGAFTSPLRAEDADNSEAAPQVPAGHHYEITDEPNTPPVNFRSEEDERYNTPAQHDAEMYAEEYERQRKEKQMKEQHRTAPLVVTSERVMQASRPAHHTEHPAGQ